MGLVRLDGAIVIGPASVSSSQMPAAQLITQLALRDGNTLSFDAASGVVEQRINSPDPAFIELYAARAVAQGAFLYVRADAKIVLRITHDDGAGGDTVILVPVHGLVLLEFPEDQPLTLLEAQGVALLEYFVAGRGPA